MFNNLIGMFKKYSPSAGGKTHIGPALSVIINSEIFGNNGLYIQDTDKVCGEQLIYTVIDVLVQKIAAL